jgi:hypothetical protein
MSDNLRSEAKLSAEAYAEMKDLVSRYENLRDNRVTIEPVKEEPYLVSAKVEYDVRYNPKYGDDRTCECGHPYYRHFDTYEDMAPVGCKYCQCSEFVEARVKPVYQTIIDPKRGNCMQAAIASLLGKELDEVPNFIDLGEQWLTSMNNFMKENGYEWKGMLWNKNFTMLTSPTAGCFKEQKWAEHLIISPENLGRFDGVKGFFYASVLSPKFFNLSDGFLNQHAVIIDGKFNVVHDPNPEYKDVIEYPLAQLLGYNGIVSIDLYEKIR